MLLSCLYLLVVWMLRLWRDLLALAVIFMSLHVASQRSIDVWVGPRESWIHWIMGCSGTNAGRWKSESLSPLCFQSCSTKVRLRLWSGISDGDNFFGTSSLRIILGYHWSNFVSNKRLLRETQMRFVTCIVREYQLQLYIPSLCRQNSSAVSLCWSVYDYTLLWKMQHVLQC